MQQTGVDFIHLLDERSEEALTMISEIEGMPIEQLQMMIDARRNVRTGFAQAVKVFTVAYFRAVLEERYKNYGHLPRRGKIDRRNVVERILSSSEFLNAVNDD